MDWDRLNQWLTLLANLGVLIGLIVLIVEVRHAISLSEREAFRNRGTEIQEAMQNLAMTPELAEIMAEVQEGRVEGLTSADKLRLNAWYGAVLRRMQNQFNDYRHGYLDDASNEAMLRAARRAFPIYEQLGNDVADQLHPSFIEAVRKTDSPPVPE